MKFQDLSNQETWSKATFTSKCVHILLDMHIHHTNLIQALLAIAEVLPQVVKLLFCNDICYITSESM
jgi:hypothetical protein